MQFTEFINKHSNIVAECAVCEPLSRLPNVELDPLLFNTPCIYPSHPNYAEMQQIYTEYIQIADKYSLPIMLTAPTWRLDQQRVKQSNIPDTVNQDAVEYLIHIREISHASAPIYIGALIGPKNDCYSPQLSLSAEEAIKFHRYQIEELTLTNVDYLIAQTMPSVDEAKGIARLLSETKLPYIISFCTGTDGNVLDGNNLNLAMQMIDNDSELKQKPLGYFINCTHPSFHTHYPAKTLNRLIGIQANGSSKDVCNLDGANCTIKDELADWSKSMQTFKMKYGIKVLGGCCGTSGKHLEELAKIQIQ